MTTMHPIKKICVVCGKTSKHFEIMSTNSFGSPDLDLRPAEMQRSTMDYWVQKCPHCGYVARSIDKEEYGPMTEQSVEEILANRSLKLCDKLAQTFYDKFLLGVHAPRKDNRGLFFDILHAAWACDDIDDETNAKLCRLLALTYLDAYLQTCYDGKEKINLNVCRTDLLRRTGQFKKLISEYNPEMYDEEILKVIIRFQLKKAREEDTSCYTVDDAVDDNQE